MASFRRRRRSSADRYSASARSFNEEQGDGGGGGAQRSAQVVALGGWLLDVAGALLDPTDRPLAAAVAVVADPGHEGGGGSSPGGCSAVGAGRAGCADSAVAGTRDSDALAITWRRGLSAAQRFAYFERKVGGAGTHFPGSLFVGFPLIFFG
jgi:hypothetical protein